MRLVIALGGNALLDPSKDLSYSVQEKQIHETVQRIAPLCQEHEVVLVHGNGPQVGGLMNQQQGEDFERPLDALVAETQGQIGYLLQCELQNAGVEASTVVTQVAVDQDDPAFDEPTKPVGPFVDQATAENQDGQYRELESGDRSYRRVVPSPKPQSIREIKQIRNQLEAGGTVIGCGGGGIPVNLECEGVEAVIDKDRAACRLGIELEADRLMVLTDIDHAYCDYPDNTDPIRETTPSELQKDVENDVFGTGSMKPKVESALQFAEETGNRAIIGSVEQPEQVLEGQGTVVVPDESP